MATKNCPECISEIPAEARVCAQCGERVEGVRCDECLALSPEQARRCRWCGTRMRTTVERELEPFEVTASLAATVLLRFSLFPQRAMFGPDKIVIRTFGFLGLTSSDEEILWEKVAGFTHRNGLLWDLVTIETRGQTPAMISCLSKEDSQRIRSVLQGLEK